MKELPYSIRLIETADLPLFRAFRKFALQESPNAFAKYPYELDEISDETLISMVCPGPGQVTFGVFTQPGELVAMAGMFRGKHGKTFHSGTIWGVYVRPEFRGKGISKLLLVELLNYALTLDDLEIVNLKVGQTQLYAKSLYLSLGFKVVGKEEKALKVDGVHISEEHMTLDLVGRR